jgi:EamA domain-containing membrane protein RarD
MAFTLLGEQLDAGRLRGFLVIWLALAVYTLDSLIAARSKSASASMTDVASQ